MMMPLYVRDNHVHALATKLAQQRHCTVTEAVRGALTEALEREETAAASKQARARAILAEFDAAPRLRPDFRDKDLYDANGNPVL